MTRTRTLSGDSTVGRTENEFTPERFSQIYGQYPEKKYEEHGYTGMAKDIWALLGEKGLTEFIRRVIFTGGDLESTDVHFERTGRSFTATAERRSLRPVTTMFRQCGICRTEAWACRSPGRKMYPA